jgi:hypothetical protein
MNITKRATRGTLLLSSAVFVRGLSPAFAQDLDEAPIAAEEDIIVPGQRLAQERAIDARRNADSVLDAIMADDIGRLA